jgi:hypothetical protein
VQDNVDAHESEKEELQMKLQEEKDQLQRKKESLLTEKVMVKETISKSCLFVTRLVQEEQDLVKSQVMKLIETLQYIHARIIELEARTM